VEDAATRRLSRSISAGGRKPMASGEMAAFEERRRCRTLSGLSFVHAIAGKPVLEAQPPK